MASFLDALGVAHLWEKIKAYIDQYAAYRMNISGSASIGTGSKVIYLKRQGNIVTAVSNSTFSPAAANTQYTLGTIPVGYRPTDGAAFTAAGIDSTTPTGGFARFHFTASGNVRVIFSKTGSAAYNFASAWFTTNSWPE